MLKERYFRIPHFLLLTSPLLDLEPLSWRLELAKLHPPGYKEASALVGKKKDINSFNKIFKTFKFLIEQKQF